MTKNGKLPVGSVELPLVLIHRIKLLVRMFGIFGLLVLGAACGGDDEIILEDLPGTWKAREPGSYIQFSADGTYRIAGTTENLERPFDQGQFTLEGTLLTYTSSDESIFCVAGQRGIYETEWTEEGALRTMMQEDDCNRRRQKTVTLERLP